MRSQTPEGEKDHLLRMVHPIFTPPGKVAVHSTAWINWEALCSGWHNPQLSPEFLGRTAAAEPIRFLFSIKQGKIKSNFKAARSNNYSIWRKKKKRTGVLCILMCTESDNCVIAQWVVSGADKDASAKENESGIYFSRRASFFVCSIWSHRVWICSHSNNESEQSLTSSSNIKIMYLAGIWSSFPVRLD